MFLYGRNSVFERLKSDPGSIKKIFLGHSFGIPDIERLIKINNISTQRMPANQLVRIKHADNLQGIIAEVNNFKYTPYEELLDACKDNKLTLIFLDRIFDPQNLGSIIRTASCFGGFAVVIPKFKACQINETVLHVASGGENYVPVSLVTNLSNAIITARKQGFWIMGAEAGPQADEISEASFVFPLGLVMGSEGKGLRYGVSKHLDARVRIPMKGAQLSFNVTIACAIFCYEIAKQR